MEKEYMIDRLVLGVVFGVAGISGLLPPDPPKPLTAQQLRIKARDDSISEMCDRKNKKSKEAQEICRRWKKRQA
jgi:hypothetical protein